MKKNQQIPNENLRTMSFFQKLLKKRDLCQKNANAFSFHPTTFSFTMEAMFTNGSARKVWGDAQSIQRLFIKYIFSSSSCFRFGSMARRTKRVRATQKTADDCVDSFGDVFLHYFSD